LRETGTKKSYNPWIDFVEAVRKAYVALRFGETVRLNPLVAKVVYLGQSLRYSNVGAFRQSVIDANRRSRPGEGLALCCRIRDEGPYLAEFIEYYLAAGIDHFFFYEKLSKDNYREALAPFIARGLVTLADAWPGETMSPSAECDCVLKAIGRFEWIGFIDADEFVVIKDGRSIGEFLGDFKEYPAVALHWQIFGSNGHKTQASGPVIKEYSRREVKPNMHVKCFVRPDRVANYRNSHSWYYLGMQRAVNENGKAVYGSVSFPPTAEQAWINHYHHKSDQEYFAKAARKSIVDRGTMEFGNRSLERHRITEKTANEVYDDSAVNYYLERCERLSILPGLALDPIAPAEKSST
jgi:hypothetical protein